MDQNADKELFHKVQEYDKYLHELLEEGDYLNAQDTDDQTIQKLRELQIPYELQQRYDVNDCPMIIIRHGLSNANFLGALVPRDLGNEVQKLSLNTHKHNKDSSLHRGGEIQAIKKSEWLNTVELELVLVSPLRRAIQTAFHLLKDHPQQGSLEIIVCPHIFEVIYNSNEMITDYQAQKQEFKRLFSENGMKINYDWADDIARQALIKDHLQLAISQNQENKKKYHDEFKNKDLESLTLDDYVGIYRRLFHENKMSGILEDGASLHKRFQRSKTELKTFFEKRGLYGQKLDRKILLVAHLYSIKCLTGKGYLGNWVIDSAIESSNCEAVPLEWENLDIEIQ